jgi:hypothetical protein
LEGGLLSDDVEAPEEGGLIAVTFSLSIDRRQSVEGWPGSLYGNMMFGGARLML